MNELEERIVSCPYCEENIHIILDGSVEEQSYIEDCQVCCRPINFLLTVDYEGAIQLTLPQEDDA